MDHSAAVVVRVVVVQPQPVPPSGDPVRVVPGVFEGVAFGIQHAVQAAGFVVSEPDEECGLRCGRLIRLVARGRGRRTGQPQSTGTRPGHRSAEVHRDSVTAGVSHLKSAIRGLGVGGVQLLQPSWERTELVLERVSSLTHPLERRSVRTERVIPPWFMPCTCTSNRPPAKQDPLLPTPSTVPDVHQRTSLQVDHDPTFLRSVTPRVTPEPNRAAPIREPTPEHRPSHPPNGRISALRTPSHCLR